MFKRKQNKSAKIDTLIGGTTRINGDVEFTGGLHLDGYINGNVKGDTGAGTFLSVSVRGCIEGSVVAPHVILNGIVKGDIEAGDRLELGATARVLGNVYYTVIETAVGAQISGKLIHRAAPEANLAGPGPRGANSDAEGANQAVGETDPGTGVSESGPKESLEL